MKKTAKQLVALVAGGVSGLMVYLVLSVLFVPGGGASGSFVGVTFLGGWALSTFLLLRGGPSVSRVIKRGFLLIAGEALAFIPLGAVVGGRGGTIAGAGVGLATYSCLGIAVALVCLLGYSVTHLAAREMTPEVANPPPLEGP